LAIGIVGQKMRNIKIIFIALAYASLVGMLLLHGLSIPDILSVEMRKSYAFAQLGLVFSSMWLWFSSLSADHRVVRWFSNRLKYIVLMWCSFLVLSGVLLWFFDQSIVHKLIYSDIGKRFITLGIILFNTWT